jgi:prephenate dehydratase
MTDTVRKIVYFKVYTPNKTGAGARILGALREAGVNLLAFTGFPLGGGRAQMDFFPENAAAFQRAAKKIGIKIAGKKTGFLVQGEDRVGAVAEYLDKLARAKINMIAADALSAGGNRFGAVLWVKSKNVSKAAKAIGAT